MKPHDPNLVPLWMGRTKGDVIKDEESEYFLNGESSMVGSCEERIKFG